MYSDHEFDSLSPEERAQREQEEEFSRRVRREVRREYRRIDRGEADEELAADEAEEAEVRAAEEERRRKAERRAKSPLWQLLTGTILVREDLSRHYPYLLCMAGMFFLSIAVLFWSLHLDMKHSRLEREVQTLRERSVRLEQRRYNLTTHSAIAAELRRRGIGLTDPRTPGELIEN